MKKTNKENKTPEYTLKLSFNDKTYKIKTDDIASSFVSKKPVILKTRLAIEITKGKGKDKKIFNRIVFVPKGRMLFNNKNWLNAFIIQAKRYLG